MWSLVMKRWLLVFTILFYPCTSCVCRRPWRKNLHTEGDAYITLCEEVVAVVHKALLLIFSTLFGSLPHVIRLILHIVSKFNKNTVCCRSISFNAEYNFCRGFCLYFLYVSLFIWVFSMSSTNLHHFICVSFSSWLLSVKQQCNSNCKSFLINIFCNLTAGVLTFSW